MKSYLMDGIVGLIALLIIGFMPFYGLFSYVLLGIFFFLLYALTPVYKSLHAKGPWAFAFAIGTFFIGAAIGYGVVLLLAAYSVTQWSPAF